MENTDLAAEFNSCHGCGATGADVQQRYIKLPIGLVAKSQKLICENCYQKLLVHFK
jgi:hypothetical protein